MLTHGHELLDITFFDHGDGSYDAYLEIMDACRHEFMLVLENIKNEETIERAFTCSNCDSVRWYTLGPVESDTDEE